MNTPLLDRYSLAADFEKRAVAIKFPPGVWNIAAALTNVSEALSSHELSNMTGQSNDLVLEGLNRLLAQKLVEQNLMSWEEYSSSISGAEIFQTVPTEAKIKTGGNTAPSKVTAPAKQSAPSKAPPSANPAPTITPPSKPAQDAVSLRLGSITPQQMGTVASSAWVSQKADSGQSTTKSTSPAPLILGDTSNGCLLRPILAQIENLKGGGVEGQLLVYQVFLRVPYQLLHDEGIKALHFVDERTLIKNPDLLAAIVKAAKDVTGMELQ